MIDLTNKRIIVTYLMHLGDVILITPFLHVLRKNAQGSKITLVVDKKVADTVRYNPNIDELVEVDKKGAANSPIENFPVPTRACDSIKDTAS